MEGDVRCQQLEFNIRWKKKLVVVNVGKISLEVSVVDIRGLVRIGEFLLRSYQSSFIKYYGFLEYR